MTKPKKYDPPNRSAVSILLTEGASMDAAVARTLTRPEIGAAATIEAWAQGTHDVNELALVLADQVSAVNRGDMQRPEALLIAQAHTLDAIFVNLMRRAVTQKMLGHWETYMRMGLKAQSQCRATLQALAELKNPPVYAKQANIAHGPQQVNNGRAPEGFVTSTRAHAHAREGTGNEPSKLLERTQHGSTDLDAGAAATPTGGDTTLEAVGAVDRAKKH